MAVSDPLSVVIFLYVYLERVCTFKVAKMVKKKLNCKSCIQQMGNWKLKGEQLDDVKRCTRIRDITDKVGCVRKTFFEQNVKSSGFPSLFYTPPNSWSGTTKCPEKYSVALSVMSLFGGLSCSIKQN